MAYRFVPFPITLNDFEGHSLIARLFKCKSTSIYFMQHFAWIQLTQRVTLTLGDS